jgi:hypothetical protein
MKKYLPSRNLYRYCIPVIFPFAFLTLIFPLNSSYKQVVSPPLRAHHALVYDEANKVVLLTAGSTPVDGGSSFTFFNDRWSFNGKEWRSLGAAGDERSGIGLAYDSKRKKIFSFGGFKNNISLSDLRILDGDAWKTIADLPEMKAAEPGFVYDVARDRLVAFGGSPGQRAANSDTWEWDGAAWKKFEGPGPGGRMGFAMVYDSKRKKTVLYGGMGTATPGQRLTDTWEFDGTSWTKVSETGPPQTLAVGHTYDSKRGLLVIFGGGSEQGISGETWGWDGKEWKQLATTGPSARMMGYMAYDKDRDRIVLFGGRVTWPNDMNDTWEWDGKKWTEIKSE